MHQVSLSVRELVSYTYFEKDIVISSQLHKKMQMGISSHKARQQVLSDEYKSEVPVCAYFEYKQLKIKVSGRIDAFCDEKSIIEEIKMCNEINEQLKRPEHWSQLVLYAAMLYKNEVSRNEITIRLAYTNIDGKLIKEFVEKISKTAALNYCTELIKNFAEFELKQIEHVKLRNKSIKEMEFPFKDYRAGQRETAIQVFTAIKLKRKLYACLPTGMGKSVAIIFPAIKSLAEGLSKRIIYLTARTSARQSPLYTIQLMQEKGAKVRCVCLLSKEKMCPGDLNCNPKYCSRAKGHFERQKLAYNVISKEFLWTNERISQISNDFNICPFEFSLYLLMLADIAIMDENYIFDPFARIQRLNAKLGENTLLIDEAHHLNDRLLDCLSGDINLAFFMNTRRNIGKLLGRKTNLYKSLSNIIKIVKNVSISDVEKTKQDDNKFNSASIILNELPKGLIDEISECKINCELLFDDARVSNEISDIYHECTSFLYAFDHIKDGYAILAQSHPKQISLFCLSVDKHIAVTASKAKGTVFFSATLQPLDIMKKLLGGNDDDAIFYGNSPFPVENLLVIRKRIDTRFTKRNSTAPALAENIMKVINQKEGKYIAYFSSYAYMKLVADIISSYISKEEIIIQEPGMDEEGKELFLNHFTKDDKPLLALCVLGGSFSEGIDLPGTRLIGVIIAGVGLPVPGFKRELLKKNYDEKYGDGYGLAYRYPGMQKILQAAGRVIRHEDDRGVVLLLDNRYFRRDYEVLFPHHWQVKSGDITKLTNDFFNEVGYE